MYVNAKARVVDNLVLPFVIVYNVNTRIATEFAVWHIIAGLVRQADVLSHNGSHTQSNLEAAI